MKTDSLRMDSTFVCFVVVVTVISIPGVLSCSNGSAPGGAVHISCFGDDLPTTGVPTEPSVLPTINKTVNDNATPGMDLIDRDSFTSEIPTGSTDHIPALQNTPETNPNNMGVLSCSNGSAPVVRMCYNNNITVTSEGFATAEGLPVISRDCFCILKADGPKAAISRALVSQRDGCRASTITTHFLSPGFVLRSKMDCSKPIAPRTYSFSKISFINQTYSRREDDDVCIKYNVVSGGAVHISCFGDDLPTTGVPTEPSVLPTIIKTVNDNTTPGMDLIRRDSFTSEIPTGSTDHIPAPQNKPETNPKNMDGVIVGVVVGSVVLVILVTLLVVHLDRNRRSKKRASKLKKTDVSVINPAYGNM